MMKACCLLMFAAALTMVIAGCEYDVAQPQWEQDYQTPPTPRITQIEPPQAAPPGANTITIRGENFAAPPGTNVVYFGNAAVGNLAAEVLESSATSIKVRRPNLVTDACTLKVVPSTALLVAKIGPYKIDRVTEPYGSFLDNAQLSVVVADNAENLYVVEAVSRNIVKVTPDVQKTVIGVSTRVPTDARIGPGGRLYLLSNNRDIEAVNLETGEITRWFRLSGSGKLAKFGDFDANGYFYTGTNRSDLMVITPDSTFSSIGVYTGTTEILAVRVYNGYVYVAARANAQSPAAIYRHSINGSGNLGPQETVIDLSTTTFASRAIRGLTFSANGTMYIATDSPDPILIVDPTEGLADILYKGILPSYCKYFYWGAGNAIYMIRGDTALGQEWTIYRVDVGVSGAPYFGG